jgi:hypothetical protein
MRPDEAPSVSARFVMTLTAFKPNAWIMSTNNLLAVWNFWGMKGLAQGRISQAYVVKS